MEAKQMLFYDFSKIALGPVIKALVHLKAEGVENIPKAGGALVVGNHRTFFDPIFVALVTERPVTWAAGSFVFNIPVVKHVFKAWGAIPLNVFGGEKAKRDLHHCVELLQTGELVGVLPEGIHTIAKPHRVSKIQHFATGFARVALMAKVPVIPTTVIGIGERNAPKVPKRFSEPFFSHPDYPDGVQWIYYKRVRVRIGKPIDLGEYYDQEMSKQMIDRISGKVRRIVIKLYNGEDLDRFMTGEKPFDIVYDRV